MSVRRPSSSTWKPDPEELTDLGADPEYAPQRAAFEARLRAILDPELVDRQAKADQARMAERYGGFEMLRRREKMKSYLPPPTVGALDPGHRRCGEPSDVGPKLRRLITKSWLLSRCYYRCRGTRLRGRAREKVWYFAYGANMDDGIFRLRRGIEAREHLSGRLRGYRLRFNLNGRPEGQAAPANLHPDPNAEVWGVLYHISADGI